MKLLCDHATECGQRCKHATAHESYGQQCEGSWLCVHVKVDERTLCKPLEMEHSHDNDKKVVFPDDEQLLRLLTEIDEKEK